VGFKSAHASEVLGASARPASRADLDFFEVHAENFMDEGGPALRQLERLSARHDLSIHGVGLSIGGVEPLDLDHLARLRRLVHRMQPRWFSEHLAWSSHGGHFVNDLLPLPYNDATLNKVCDHLDQLQAALGRQVLIENPSTYLEFDASTMTEGAFLTEVIRRSGCALLLDVNNIHVSAINHGRDPLRDLRAMPLHAAQEIHLAGFAEDSDAKGDRLLIDHHGAAVAEAVWRLYEQAVSLTGPLPTLIERDHDVPPFQTLMREAHRARDIQAGWRCAA
jgi:uncharacterized protein (UPF0276 family)